MFAFLFYVSASMSVDALPVETRRGTGFPELKLQASGSHHVGTCNRTQVFQKSHQDSWLQSHLPRPNFKIFKMTSFYVTLKRYTNKFYLFSALPKEPNMSKTPYQS